MHNEKLKNLREFMEHTSIHGILYVFQQKLSKSVRFIWALIFLVVFFLCIEKSRQDIVEYLKFQVKTSTTLNIDQELMFPEITFCSYYYIKRSSFGNYSAANLFLASLAAHNQEQFIKYVPKMSRTCRSNKLSWLTKFTNEYGTDALYNYTHLAKFLKTSVSRFNTDVVKCWWSDKERNCDELFTNEISDMGYCFAMNVGKKFAKFAENDLLIFGQNLTQYDENEFRINNWASNKFRLLLNANQDEYCGKSISGDHGAGFHAFVTETDSVPSTSLETSVFLSPGYVNNVILSRTKHSRFTEHLDLCISDADLFLFPAIHKYIQPLCFAQCGIIECLKRCRCYPVNYAGLHELFVSNVNKLGIPNATDAIRLCRESEMLCAVTFMFEVFLKEHQSTICPICKIACFETRYKSQITRSLLSTSSLKYDLKNVTVMSEEDMRKNYLYVNIGFDSKEVYLVEESQAITLVDLFICFGNNIGLFLGMSFMSNFEVIVNVFLRELTNLSIFRTFLNKLKLKLFIRNVQPVKTVQLRRRRKTRAKNIVHDIR